MGVVGMLVAPFPGTDPQISRAATVLNRCLSSQSLQAGSVGSTTPLLQDEGTEVIA